MTKRKPLNLRALEVSEDAAHSMSNAAQKELELVRRRIMRKKEPLTPLEYALQWEDLMNARLAAEKIEQLIAGLQRMSFILVEVAEKQDVSRYTAGTLSNANRGIELRTSGATIRFFRAISWTVNHKPDQRQNPLLYPPLLLTEVQKDYDLEIARCPLHKRMPWSHTQTFDYFVKNEEREKGKKAFEFLCRLYRDLLWSINQEGYAEMWAEAKQETADACERQARDLMAIIDEGFVHGARPVSRHHSSADNNDSLSRRMIELREQMADTLRRCELYGVDNEHRVKIETFFKHFLNGHSFVNVPVR